MKLKYSLVTAVALFLAATLPDIFYRLYNPNYLAGYDSKSTAIAALLMAFLALSPLYRINLAALIIFALMQSTQLMYFQYYGNFYSAFDIILMMGELEDAATGFIDVARFLWFPFLVSVLLFSAAIYWYQQTFQKMYTHKAFGVLLVLLILLPVIQSIKSSSSQKFQPNVAHSALKNGLYSVSYFLVRQGKIVAGMREPIGTYKPYQLTKINPVDANIVVLMGESLNTMNMGLYGYHRDTTPALDDLTEDPNFFFTPAISSAVSTRVSLALFFNTVYEPDNAAHLKSMDTALFKLAKESGFHTHYITTQKNAGGLSYSFSPTHIDTWKENKHLDHFESQYDDRLLMALKELKLNYDQPQFITLHMRSTHTPYVENYPKEREVYPVDGMEYEDYLINSYDNSVLYTQQVIADIYEFFNETNKPTYIFFTPDHGELMGQNGRFGHNAVDLEIGRVPFLFYGVDIPNAEIEKVKTKVGCMPTHYEISKVIAELLGTKIENPNEELGFFYLNGTGVFGEAGYLKFEKSMLDGVVCS